MTIQLNYHHLALLAYLFCLSSCFWNFRTSPASRIYTFGYHSSLFLRRKLLAVIYTSCGVTAEGLSLREIRFLVDFLRSINALSSIFKAVRLFFL